MGKTGKLDLNKGAIMKEHINIIYNNLLLVIILSNFIN